MNFYAKAPVSDASKCKSHLSNMKKKKKNCEPELSYILAELFSMCMKKSCFVGTSDLWTLY